MRYDALPIAKSLDAISIHKNNKILHIIMRDGTPLLGKILGVSPNYVEDNKSVIVLCYVFDIKIIFILVPISEISGIYFLDITQEQEGKIDRFELGNFNNNSYIDIFKGSIDKAIANNFLIGEYELSPEGLKLSKIFTGDDYNSDYIFKRFINYSEDKINLNHIFSSKKKSIDRMYYFERVRFRDKFEFLRKRELKFNEDSPIYSDWGYLQHISGGITSIGISGLGFGASFGWSKSLWSLFDKKINQKQSPVSSLCTRKDTVLVGHVFFFPQVGDKSDEVLNSKLDMEGCSWIAAAVSRYKIRSMEDQKPNIWELIYFRSDSFMFPNELWADISNKIKIFAEVIPVSLDTNFGKKLCFLKARCAAVILSHEEGL